MTLELSIPDALADAAHRTAALLGMSRSELYARAVAAFLHAASEGARTERAGAGSNPGPVWTEGLSQH